MNPSPITLALALSIAATLTSCGPKAPETGTPSPSVSASTSADGEDRAATGTTGTFTVDGKTYTGKVTLQTFPSNKAFSVICQDDAFGLVQITFHNEADARKAQTVKLTDLSYSKANEPGTANISLSPFAGGETNTSESAGGTATITADSGGKATITFENAALSTKTSDLKKTLSGKVTY